MAAISSIFTNSLVGCGSRITSFAARSGVMPRSRARSWICFYTSGVYTNPGQIELAVTPCSATSSATVLVNPTMPCLAAT